MDLSELQGLRIQELSELAKTLKISDDISGLNKQELTVKILEAQAEKDGSVALTRRSSVSRQSDGSLIIDDGVPDAVKQMLQQMEAEKSPASGGLSAGSSTSGGNVLSARSSSCPSTSSSNQLSNCSDSIRPRSNSLMSGSI